MRSRTAELTTAKAARRVMIGVTALVLMSLGAAPALAAPAVAAPVLAAPAVAAPVLAAPVLAAPALAAPLLGSPADRGAPHSAATIPLPFSLYGAPSDLAIDSRTHTVYVADHDQVVAVDEKTGTSSVFGLGLGGRDGSIDLVAVDPAYSEVFVASDDGHENASIAVFAGAARSKIATIPVAGGVRSMTIDERTHTLITVGNTSGKAGISGTATFIDEGANAVTGTALVGSDPTSVAVDDETGTVYVANQTAGFVSILDAVGHTTVAVVGVGVGDRPLAVAVDSVSHRAFVTDGDGDSVWVIGSVLSPFGGAPAYSVLTSIHVAGSPWGVAVDSTTQLVYVAPEGGHAIAVIDEFSGAVTENVGPVTGQPLLVAVDESSHSAYAISRGTFSLTAVNPMP